MKEYKFHPLAEKLPMMPGDDLAELAEDIKTNGQQEQIVLLDNQIIDGRGRYRACQIAKVKPDCRTYQRTVDGNDPVAFVATHNIFRRHMTPAQRAISLAELRKEQKWAKSPCASEKAPIGASLDAVAEGAGISSRTMDRASKVVNNSPPEIVAAVKAEEVSVSDAAAIADLRKSEQKEALKKVKRGEAKTLKAAAATKPPKTPKAGRQTSDPRAWDRWEEIYGKLKRETDAVHKVAPAEKFCRQMHDALNNVLEISKDWRRAVR